MALVAVGVLGGVLAAVRALPAAEPPRTTAPSVHTELAGVPVSFVANHGRWDARAAWVSSGRDATAYFVDGGVRWALAGAADGPGWVLDQSLVGARAARPTASAQGPGLVSYLVGSEHHSGLPTATELVLDDAWPGVDVVWSGAGGQIETTYRLDAGADPGRVRVAWRGAEALAVTSGGRLSVTTPVRTFEEDAPKAFQEVGGRRVPVDVAFAVEGDSYGFRLGTYDPTQPLVIDPVVLMYAGFLGGSGISDDDVGWGIALDASGNSYVTGWTSSDAGTFPETPGVFQPHNAGGMDAFVAKVNPSGSALVYATFLGGSGEDWGFDIAVDGAGSAYVVGQTDSAAATFPDTPGAFQPENGGDWDAFVAKLNPAGSALVYASFYGGTDQEDGWGIAVDAAGNAYITGDTASLSRGTIDIAGPFLQDSVVADYDAYVAKVNPSGTDLVYEELLGGAGIDWAYDIAVDAAGNAYVTGDTDSVASTFPQTPGAFQPQNAGGLDAFVAKLGTNGTVAYSTFVGGRGDDGALGIAVDGAGNAYISGWTESTAATFPDTPGAFQSENAGAGDAFVAKVNTTGTGLAYATFLGGSNQDGASGIAVDSAGNAYVAGTTSSLAETFPETPGAFQTENGGSDDAFVAKVNATGAALVHASFLGGSDDEEGLAIAVDGSGNAYVTGLTYSTAATFPETPGVFQPENGGSPDAFVAKIAEQTGPPACTQTRTGDIVGPLTVAAGQTLCLNAARLAGPLTVNAGGAVLVSGSRIAGGLRATGALYIRLCGSYVAGGADPASALVVSGTTGTVIVGDPANSCAANRVAGDSTFSGNSGWIRLDSTTISGNLHVNANASASTVAANSIYKTLACSANSPVPTNAGRANAAASKTGQCAAL